MADRLRIDGAHGEGGGQILRTSLALAAVTGRAVEIFDLRAARPKPGLMRQHLTAVLAAAAVCDAEVDGAELGSQRVVFRPGRIAAGDHTFDVGTAGSVLLVLQTVLPPLLAARGRSTLVLRGGTHNPAAPPFEFVEQVFLPALARMGARVSVSLVSHGFYPAGGGEVHVTIEGAEAVGAAAGTTRALAPLELLERGPVRRLTGRVLFSNLPDHLARREESLLRSSLELDEMTVLEVASPGPGNVVMVCLEAEHQTELLTGFGQRGIRAEAITRRLADEVEVLLETRVPVGPFLADQLLLPMVMAGGGVFRTVEPSRHLRTNLDVIQRFVDLPVTLREEEPFVWRVQLG